MRKAVVENCRILFLKDYSHSEVALFRDATDYPLILAIQKSLPGANSVPVEVVAFSRQDSWKVKQSELPILPGDPMSPWIMAPPEVIEAFRRMQVTSFESGFIKSRRLGDIYDVHMGVKTSRNELF